MVRVLLFDVLFLVSRHPHLGIPNCIPEYICYSLVAIYVTNGAGKHRDETCITEEAYNLYKTREVPLGLRKNLLRGHPFPGNEKYNGLLM